MPVAVPTTTSTPLLEMRGIDKSFGSQQVLRQVNFDLRPGEVHVLAGENGAGKSTLIRILGGAHHADAGSVHIRGREAHFRRPGEARRGGVAIIHQELSLVGSMSVADNLFLGQESSRLGWIDRPAMSRRAAALLERVGLHLDPQTLVSHLPISSQQLVEVAKALALDARIIVMDEPTSALSEPEVRNLFARIDDLKAQSCGIIYITHRLQEIYTLADRISILRDGQLIATRDRDDLPADELVRLMVGRTISDQAPRRDRCEGATRLNVAHCTVRATDPTRRPTVDDVSLQVRTGEILGLVGLEGSGVSEALWTIFGALGRRASCAIEIDGQGVRINSPRDAIAAGMALVTNDRKRTGLVLGMDIVENTTLATLPHLSPLGWLQSHRETIETGRLTAQLNLRATSLNQPVGTLSGGNQQKVVLARWMHTAPRVLLLDEPTRGVDVGAKHEIYLLMNEWAKQGCSIVISSSEWPELLAVSDRIMVMHRGRAVATFENGQATAADLLRTSMGFAGNG